MAAAQVEDCFACISGGMEGEGGKGVSTFGYKVSTKNVLFIWPWLWSSGQRAYLSLLMIRVQISLMPTVFV